MRGVLHGESSKRLATPRNTKDKKHLQSTQSAQPTKFLRVTRVTHAETHWQQESLGCAAVHVVPGFSGHACGHARASGKEAQMTSGACRE